MVLAMEVMVALISLDLISESMADLESDQEKFCNRAFNILLPVSETDPSLLYPQRKVAKEFLRKYKT